MQIPRSIIDPKTATPDQYRYVVALKDDDWSQRDSLDHAPKYNGCRRHATEHWNLRDLSTGAPVGWNYTDTDIIVLSALVE